MATTLFTPTCGAVMIKFVRDIFTEDDNQTWDMNRVAFFMGLVTFLGAFIDAVVFNHQEFRWTDVGIGFAGVLGSGGGIIAVNAKRNHNDDSKPTS